uniref:Ubiquitin-like protease family profile domain-containing protein n=1 Tax=Kalanchoe fedtschenkoi TaxID=63787 RepID=A0A7N1A444_KALFE
MVRSTAAGDEKILSYEDVVLRRSDLDILSGPEFLNDRIIEFYFSYLTSSSPSGTILFLSPAITFWVANCQDAQAISDVLEPLNLPSYNIIVFPVNNNEDVGRAEGGSHWSLLAYHKKGHAFLHHDSSSGMNRAHALRLFKCVSLFLDASGSLTYMEVADTPQQVNGYDCGLYVLAIAKVISDWNEKNKEADWNWVSEIKKQVTPANVAALRGEVLELIRSMMGNK